MNYLEDIVKENYQKFSNINYELNQELHAKEYKNAYILPVNKHYNPHHTLCGTGGVLDENEEYIISSGQFGHNMSDRVYGKYNFNKEKCIISNEKVIYLNYFIPHWGHYLLDVIGRLWYILKNDISDYKIAYTCRLGKKDPIKGNYLELLKLLGIDETKLIMVNKVTRFSEVIIPDTSIYPGKYYTKEYKKIFDRIVENSKVEFSNEKNFYCSRAMIKHKIKREIGEEDIEKVFNDNGYESVYLEKMTLKEQIAILNSAKNIACVSGTLPHNLLFIRNNAKVTILNKTYKLNLHQFLINQICNLDISFVDVNLSPTPVLYGMGPFIIMVTDCFKQYCKDHNMECNIPVNYHIGFKTKIWYYITYLISYRGKIIRETEINSTSIRKLYKTRQKN